MRLLAIDPGPEETAFVIWDTETNKFCFSPEHQFRCGILENEFFLSLCADWYPLCDSIAIEMIQSYGMPVGKSTFQTALFVGRIIEHIRMIRYTVNNIHEPKEVKLYGRPAIKGQIGGQNDTQIRQALRIRFGDAKRGEPLEGVKKDVWAALALAVALSERPQLREW